MLTLDKIKSDFSYLNALTDNLEVYYDSSTLKETEKCVIYTLSQKATRLYKNKLTNTYDLVLLCGKINKSSIS